MERVRQEREKLYQVHVERYPKEHLEEGVLGNQRISKGSQPTEGAQDNSEEVPTQVLEESVR